MKGSGVHMPKSVRISLWLLVTGVIATLVTGLLDPTPTPAFPEGSGPVVILSILMFFVPSLGLMIFFAVMTYRRRNWARWVHSAISLLGLVLYVPAQVAAFEVSAYLSLLNLVLAGVELASLTLLWTRESNAWYSATVATAT